MTGKEIIEFIKNNKLEEFTFRAFIIPEGSYPEDGIITEIETDNISIYENSKKVEIY